MRRVARSTQLHRRVTAAVAAMLVAGSVTPFVVGAASAQQAGCPSRFAAHSVIASASGLQVIEYVPGVTIVETADAALPQAQAAVDSSLGSLGFAGAPYSGTIADNTGQARATPNDLPNFAVSSYPAEPNNIEKTSPGARLATSSGPTSSDASVVLGVAGGIASESATARAECGDDGLAAAAENHVEAINIAGVLSIGAVRSRASAVLGPDGTSTLDASLDIEGATVAGQPVSITDEGVRIADAVLPLPGNPVADILEGAGITLTYLGPRRDDDSGEITAPALEIVVAAALPVGSAPATTTFVVGGAFARASVSSVVNPPSTTPTTTAAGPGQSPPTRAPTTGAAPSAAGTASAPVVPAQPAVDVPVSEPATSLIASWSILPAFSALAVGALLFVVSWVAFGKLTARFRWT